jgi:methionine sulfoxide reductase heme-binding subunit
MRLPTAFLPPPHVRKPEPALSLPLVLMISFAATAAVLSLWSVLAGTSLSPVTWYIARSSGLVLYLLTWALLMSGLGATTKLLVSTGHRALSLSLHGFAFHLWYGLLVLHMLTIALDTSVDFGPREVLIPFASGWREPWTGLGVLAGQVGVLVGASIGIRRLLGYRLWKAMHWLSIPVFAMGLLHGLLAGTDSSSLAVFTMYVVTGGWIVFLTAFRVLQRHARSGKRDAKRRQAILARDPRSRLTARDS